MSKTNQPHMLAGDKKWPHKKMPGRTQIRNTVSLAPRQEQQTHKISPTDKPTLGVQETFNPSNQNFTAGSVKTHFQHPNSSGPISAPTSVYVMSLWPCGLGCCPRAGMMVIFTQRSGVWSGRTFIGNVCHREFAG